MARLSRDHRLSGRIRHVGKASGGVVPGPFDSSIRIEEEPSDVQVLIVDLTAALNTMPVDGVRDDSGIRRPVVNGIRDAPKIADMQVGNVQLRGSLA